MEILYFRFSLSVFCVCVGLAVNCVNSSAASVGASDMNNLTYIKLHYERSSVALFACYHSNTWPITRINSAGFFVFLWNHTVKGRLFTLHPPKSETKNQALSSNFFRHHAFFFTPPRNRGGVIFLLQFVCLSVCVCVCLSVRLWTKCRSNRYTDFDAVFAE